MFDFYIMALKRLTNKFILFLNFNTTILKYYTNVVSMIKTSGNENLTYYIDKTLHFEYKGRSYLYKERCFNKIKPYVILFFIVSSQNFNVIYTKKCFLHL